MPPSQQKQPKEVSLYMLLHEIQDIERHCFACQQTTLSEASEYLTNLATRTKLVIACSAHFDYVLMKILAFQDPTRRNLNPASEDVIPDYNQIDSIYHIHNFTLRINGRAVKILLATDDPRESLGKYNPLTQYKERVQPLLNQPGPDPEHAVKSMSDLSLQTNADVPLSGAEQILALAAGLAQMDVAFEAVENAISKLRLLGPEAISSRVKCRTLQRTIRVLNSTGAIAKLVQDKGGAGAGVAASRGVATGEMGVASGRVEPKVCFEENNFVDGEAIPYVKESMKEVLKPREQARIGQTGEWLNTL